MPFWDCGWGGSLRRGHLNEAGFPIECPAILLCYGMTVCSGGGMQKGLFHPDLGFVS